jgi:hypothetical protein
MSAPPLILVPDTLWEKTLAVFQQYTRKRTEAGCLWYGIRTSDVSLACGLGIPRQTSRPLNFTITADALSVLTQTACADGLVAIAQIHLHPATDVAHSCWDDTQIVSRNVYSVVLPRYGSNPIRLRDIGLHRFQHGEWQRLSVEEAQRSMRIVATFVDTR